MKQRTASVIAVALLFAGVFSALKFSSGDMLNVDALISQSPFSIGKTWFVDDDGPADFHIIQEAINVASAGDTIFVYNGTYCEHVIVNKTVSLIGESRNITTIDGGGEGYAVELAADNVAVSGFSICNGCNGVFIRYYGNNTVSGNMITGNKWDGIFVDDSCYNNISNNVISSNARYGMEIVESSFGGNTISGNRILDNDGAMWIGKNSGYYPNILKENEMIGNHYGLEILDGHGTTYAVVDSSNTVDGKPVYYLVSQSNLVIDSSTFPEIGYLGIVNSVNITIRNLSLSKNGQGIRIADSDNVQIQDVVVSNNRVGIDAESIGWYTDCSILNSKMLNNEYGLSLVCSDRSTVRNNTISNNTIGVSLDGMSLGNRIINNTISDNEEYGIYEGPQGGNIFYYNNFIDNAQQVSKQYTIFPSTWNHGYPLGGNYWSDYSGTDEYRGPCQNETGSDGIGDTPYVIYANISDRYPQMNLLETFMPNIAFTDITASKMISGPSYVMSISIRVENQGSQTETLNVTIYANTTMIATFTNVSLTEAGSTTLNYTWKVYLHGLGSYVITAIADPVPNEMYAEDNAISTAIGEISFPGDFDIDFKVGPADFAFLSAAYGSKPGDPKWNSNCDANLNNRIDPADFALLATNFGKHYP